MFSRKKPQELSYATVLIREALSIAWAYKRDTHQPDATSLRGARDIERELWKGILQIGYVIRDFEKKLGTPVPRDVPHYPTLYPDTPMSRQDPDTQ